MTDWLISKYLSNEQQVSLITNLVEKDQLEDLTELLSKSSLDISENEILVDTIFQKVKSQLTIQLLNSEIDDENAINHIDVVDNENMRIVAQLIVKIQSLWIKFEKWMAEVLLRYIIKNNMRLFNPAFYNRFINDISDELHKETISSVENENISIVLILRFLESVYLYASGDSSIQTYYLDSIIIPLLGANVDIVVSSSAKLMRWRIKQVAEKCNSSSRFDKLIWDTVQYLYSEGLHDDEKERNALTFCLRFLSIGKVSKCLKEFIRSKQYWENLQHALDHEVHEYRKLGLSVLQLTIQAVYAKNEPFETTLFTWIPYEKEEIITTWKKFTTLYEIIALDTAMNQFEAATPNLLSIFEDKYIYPGWTMLLFSTGLNASMESVRKYTVSLIFKINDRSVFASNLNVLKLSILPSIMQAQLYKTDGKLCSHGEAVIDFVSDLVIHGKSDKEVILNTLLETLIEHGASFDAARIYVSFGILSAMKGEDSKLLTPYHLNLIRKLFEFETEDAVAETTIQTIYIKLLLHINLDVSAIQWIQTLVTYISCSENGYSCLYPLFEAFKDFAVINFDPTISITELSSMISENTTFDVFANVLFGVPVVPSKSFIIELAKSNEIVDNYTSNVVELFLKLLNETLDDAEYKNSDILVQYQGFTSNTWRSRHLEVIFRSFQKGFSGYKFKFFVSVYRNFVNNSIDSLPVTIQEVLDLYDVIKNYFQNFTPDQYKFKDEIYSSYFDFVAIFLTTTALEGSDGQTELYQLLSLMKANIFIDNGNYNGNTSVCILSKYILKTYIVQREEYVTKYMSEILILFSILTELWNNVNNERLVLKQRKFHLELIDTIFNQNLLYISTIKGNNFSIKMKEIGFEIIDQSFSRRGFLPLLASNISKFAQMHFNHLSESNRECFWIIEVLQKLFIQPQMSSNVFKIKSTLALLYDQSLRVYKNSTDSLYKEVYGIEELSARVLVIDTFLNIPVFLKIQFVQSAIKDTTMLYANKRTDGPEEVERILLWQLVILCMPSFSSHVLAGYSNSYFLDTLLDEGSPLVRIYKEWFIAYELVNNYNDKKASNSEEYLFQTLVDHSKPILVVSAEKIIFLCLKALSSNPENCYQRLLNRFIGRLVPNASSNKPLVRHFSNSLMISFWPVVGSLIEDKTMQSVLKTLFDNAKMSEVTGKYRSGDANLWELHEDLTLTNIFGIILRKTTDHSVTYIPADLFKRYLNHQSQFQIGSNDESDWLERRDNGSNHTDKATSNQMETQLQTKSGAWEAVLDIDSKKSEQSVVRSDLIVVSSLVDKPPNLGGICRLCDVLGVGLLTVQDIEVKKHPQFKNVAVTADKWMPMEEVPTYNIIEFMKSKKREGYTLIGLEQTDKSVQLNNDYKFPKKSLILLGTEAHGIPGHLLSELDLCLEIQQHGVIRSMNIQTATAVIVYSYTVQHM